MKKICFSEDDLNTLLGKVAINKQIRLQPKGESQRPMNFESFFKVRYLPTLTFSSLAMIEEVQSVCPWLLWNTFFGTEHRRLGSLLRQKLMQGFVEAVSIRWIDDEIGYGLFAEKDFPEDTYIGEYAGMVRAIHVKESDVNGYCLRLPSSFFSTRLFVIDAMQAGNEMRFMNHSDTPNVRPITILDRKLCHVGFFTKRAIAKGEELTFSYGKPYWQKRTKSRR